MQDWNGNGKNDLFDQMTEYDLYEQYTRDASRPPQKGGRSESSCGAIVVAAVVALLVVGAVCGELEIKSSLAQVILWAVSTGILYGLYRLIKS